RSVETVSIVIGNADTPSDETVTSDRHGLRNRKRAVVTDKSSITHGQSGIAGYRSAEQDARLTRQAHSGAQHDPTGTGNVRQLLQGQPRTDRVTTGAKQWFVPHRAYQPGQRLAHEDVDDVRALEDAARRHVHRQVRG